MKYLRSIRIGRERDSARFSFRKQLFSSSFWLRSFLILLCGIAVIRLFWLQSFRGEVWRVQAEGNRRQRVAVQAPRGLIFDTAGKVLAGNRIQFVETYVDETKRVRERFISTEDAISLQATSPATVKKVYRREYPYGPILSHVLGYVSGGRLTTDRVVGEAGIERFSNTDLSGFDGEVWYERSARGQAHRVLAEREPKEGTNVTLTLDAELSRVAFEALGEQRGAVIVSTPRGEVLAAVSTPSFLPIYPNSHIDDGELRDESDQWGSNVSKNLVAALQDEYSPMLFRVTNGAYPPGSVFKVVTALAGLERGAITSTTTVDDQGVLTVGEFTYQNWYWRQYGRVEGLVNVVRALGRSNDIFFYRLAEWIGPDSLAEFATWFGYGAVTGFEGQREQIGIVPTPAWKQQFFGERWYLGNTFHMGIGQGDVLVTPAQVQVMMNTVATRGRKCTLHVLADSRVSCQEISLQPSTWSAVEQGLHEACAPGGTGYPFFTSPYDVLCKTGTAEFGAADSRGYRPTHGWFTAAVSSAPRRSSLQDDFLAEYVITVMVESDDTQLYKEGSRDAAPIARAVADYLLLNIDSADEEVQQ